MKSLPRVVILGYPNVGKSTLFNRLAGRKKALIHNLPGMTRDCLEVIVTRDKKKFIVVDTGGLFGVADEPLSHKVRERAWSEARQADLILFVVDLRQGISPAEKDLLISIKKMGVRFFLVVNKVDSPELEPAAAAFYSLGASKTFLISAEHKLNLDQLEEALVAEIPDSEASQSDRALPLKIAIVGRINVGKSSIVNRLLGEERLLVSEIPGTTRDSTDSYVVRNGRQYCLVDTAGIRKMSGTEDSREKAGIIRAKANIKRSDVVCLVLDAREFPTRQDARIAQIICEAGKPIVIAVNKWDLIDKSRIDQETVCDLIFRKLSFVSYSPVLFVSARTGQRVARILETAREVWENACRHIETSKLNSFLEGIAKAHPPRLEDGRRAKLMYITQKGTRPPTFILFLGKKGKLAPAYERFFLDKLRNAFGLSGTPLKLIVRSS